MPQNAETPDERAPLLASQPTTLDRTDETLLDERISEEAAPRISVARGILCVFALGLLIFLQGEHFASLVSIPLQVKPDCPTSLEQMNAFYVYNHSF